MINGNSGQAFAIMYDPVPIIMVPAVSLVAFCSFLLRNLLIKV
jgi:hypothetical protein